MKTIVVGLFVLVSISMFGASADALAQSGSAPEQPRVLLNTTYNLPGGVTRTVGAGGNLQAALDAANPGDVIVLQAGATYTGNFLLRAKTGSAYIYIRTSAPDSSLPAPGVRVGPSYASAMPKIVTPNVSPAIRTVGLANYYRFVGVEFAVASNVALNYGIISLGSTTTQTTLGAVPHDLVLDRCYIHGNENGRMTRGVALNSARTAVIDSYISECHGVGVDTQAICGWNGPGPFKIMNNYLEAAGENVMFGGADPTIPNLVPSDIEFRSNYLSKPRSWYRYDASFDGVNGDRSKHWTVKNALELKNVRRILVGGNTFENCWVDGQTGFAIVLTPRNQDGTAPWSAVQDVTFQNNIVRHAAGGVNMLGYDDAHQSQQLRRVLIQNNLFDDLGDQFWGNNGRLFQITNRTAYVTINHNTAFHTAQIIMASGSPNTGFAYTNNISPHNVYGVIGTGTGVGQPTLTRYFPGCTFQRNVMTGGPSTFYPALNYFPATMDAVGFVDAAGGNYELTTLSPYSHAATDGSSLGAHMDVIDAAQSADNP